MTGRCFCPSGPTYSSPNRSGQNVVELDCPQLPFPSKHVADEEIDFRSIKCRLALGGDEWQFHLGKHLGELPLGQFPQLGIACEFRAGWIAEAQPDFNIPKFERLKYELDQIDGAAEFLLNLFGSAEQVGIILREAPDAGQPVQLAALFITINRAEFRQTHRKIAIALGLGRRRSECDAGNSSA